MKHVTDTVIHACVPLARLSHEDKTSLLKEHRRTELESRQQLFRFEATLQSSQVTFSYITLNYRPI